MLLNSRNVSLVTQNEDAPNIEDQLNESTLLKAVSKVNPLYATVLGNPSECVRKWMKALIGISLQYLLFYVALQAAMIKEKKGCTHT